MKQVVKRSRRGCLLLVSTRRLGKGAVLPGRRSATGPVTALLQLPPRLALALALSLQHRCSDPGRAWTRSLLSIETRNALLRCRGGMNACIGSPVTSTNSS
ncbi:hypothetical protein BO71DRAFT_56403 [Aspergillus ellipticus CBS 707.79]|uniref:Uncharacterized protein n=1 Tax=Aspergillus ellipticus CBS 707.79 TaxID=1448320 RepID=A0A319D241_9EURO|nr:hypothetical protein BO71DRAFT_56403 [Aspergillus ellipticus CBS 707.79]